MARQESGHYNEANKTRSTYAADRNKANKYNVK